MEPPAPDALPDDRREAALAQALFVAFLWSTSWPLIRAGLHGGALAPLTFAGLRYTIAALVLLPFAYRGLRRARPDRRALLQVGILGLVFYAVAQGAQFVALDLLPAAAVSLVLTMSPVAIVVIGAARGDERPSPLQLTGIFVLVVGAALYFLPLTLGAAAAAGLAVAVAGMVANAASTILGRHIAREATGRLGGIVPMTALSMLLGGAVMLAAGIATSGPPRLDVPAWTLVFWLALVNTAFAFALWNHTLRTLSAIESNVLNNTMLAQIALLAWIFLGESLNGRQLLGIALAMAGVAIVQLAPVIDRSRTQRAAGGGPSWRGPR
jgi:drug/metabolite transporter (DMT)-like permease